MKPKWLNIRLIAKLGLIAGAGWAAGYFLPTEAYKSATTVLATFAGVVVAALVPTMLLAATILRPISKGKNEFQKVRGAVARQISYFSGLFLLTLVLAMLMFAGSLADWKDLAFTVTVPIGDTEARLTVAPIRILGGSIVALASLIAIQMTGFVHGIRSLFTLHANNAEKELDRLIEEENRASASAVLPRDPRTRIGENIGELH